MPAGRRPTDVSTRFYATYIDYYAELPRELTPAQYAADPRQARADAIAGNHSKKVETWRLAFKTTVARDGRRHAGSRAPRTRSSRCTTPSSAAPFFSLLIDTDHKDSGAMVRYHRAAGAHDLLFGAQLRLLDGQGRQLPEHRRRAAASLMWTTDDDASTLELFALDRWNFAPQWTLVYGTQFVSADRDVERLQGQLRRVQSAPRRDPQP